MLLRKEAFAGVEEKATRRICRRMFEWEARKRRDHSGVIYGIRKDKTGDYFCDSCTSKTHLYPVSCFSSKKTL
jgi:hypothetical protein